MFGVSAAVHAILIAGLFITAVTFKVATKKPVYFGSIGNTSGGEHE